MRFVLRFRRCCALWPRRSYHGKGVEDRVSAPEYLGELDGMIGADPSGGGGIRLS